QAEDGIRDFHVTGVQTCALPISPQVVDGVEPVVVGGQREERQYRQDQRREDVEVGVLADRALGLPHLQRRVYDLQVVLVGGVANHGPDAVVELEVRRGGDAPLQRVVGHVLGPVAQDAELGRAA